MSSAPRLSVSEGEHPASPPPLAGVAAAIPTTVAPSHTPTKKDPLSSSDTPSLLAEADSTQTPARSISNNAASHQRASLLLSSSTARRSRGGGDGGSQSNSIRAGTPSSRAIDSVPAPLLLDDGGAGTSSTSALLKQPPNRWTFTLHDPSDVAKISASSHKLINAQQSIDVCSVLTLALQLTEKTLIDLRLRFQKSLEAALVTLQNKSNFDFDDATAAGTGGATVPTSGASTPSSAMLSPKERTATAKEKEGASVGVSSAAVTVHNGAPLLLRKDTLPNLNTASTANAASDAVSSPSGATAARPSISSKAARGSKFVTHVAPPPVPLTLEEAVAAKLSALFANQLPPTEPMGSLARIKLAHFIENFALFFGVLAAQWEKRKEQLQHTADVLVEAQRQRKIQSEQLHMHTTASATTTMMFSAAGGTISSPATGFGVVGGGTRRNMHNTNVDTTTIANANFLAYQQHLHAIPADVKAKMGLHDDRLAQELHEATDQLQNVTETHEVIQYCSDIKFLARLFELIDCGQKGYVTWDEVSNFCLDGAVLAKVYSERADASCEWLLEPEGIRGISHRPHRLKPMGRTENMIILDRSDTIFSFDPIEDNTHVIAQSGTLVTTTITCVEYIPAPMDVFLIATTGAELVVFDPNFTASNVERITLPHPVNVMAWCGRMQRLLCGDRHGRIAAYEITRSRWKRILPPVFDRVLTTHAKSAAVLSKYSAEAHVKPIDKLLTPHLKREKEKASKVQSKLFATTKSTTAKQSPPTPPTSAKPPTSPTAASGKTAVGKGRSNSESNGSLPIFPKFEETGDDSTPPSSSSFQMSVDGASTNDTDHPRRTSSPSPAATAATAGGLLTATNVHNSKKNKSPTRNSTAGKEAGGGGKKGSAPPPPQNPSASAFLNASTATSSNTGGGGTAAGADGSKEIAAVAISVHRHNGTVVIAYEDGLCQVLTPPYSTTDFKTFMTVGRPLCCIGIVESQGAVVAGTSEPKPEVWSLAACEDENVKPHLLTSRNNRHEAPIVSITTFVDSDQCFSLDFLGLVKIWDLRTNAPLQHFKLELRDPRIGWVAMQGSGAGDAVYCCDRQHVIVFRKSDDVKAAANALFSKRTKHSATADAAAAALANDPEQLHLIQQQKNALRQMDVEAGDIGANIIFAAYSALTQRIIAVTAKLVYYHDPATGKMISESDILAATGHNAAILSGGVDDDGNSLALVSSSLSAAGRTMLQHVQSKREITAAMLDRTGARLYCGLNTGAVVVVNTASGGVVEAFPYAHRGSQVECFTFIDHLNCAVSCSADGSGSYLYRPPNEFEKVPSGMAPRPTSTNLDGSPNAAADDGISAAAAAAANPFTGGNASMHLPAYPAFRCMTGCVIAYVGAPTYLLLAADGDGRVHAFDCQRFDPSGANSVAPLFVMTIPIGSDLKLSTEFWGNASESGPQHKFHANGAATDRPSSGRSTTFLTAPTTAAEANANVSNNFATPLRVRSAANSKSNKSSSDGTAANAICSQYDAEDNLTAFISSTMDAASAAASPLALLQKAAEALRDERRRKDDGVTGRRFASELNRVPRRDNGGVASVVGLTAVLGGGGAPSNRMRPNSSSSSSNRKGKNESSSFVAYNTTAADKERERAERSQDTEILERLLLGARNAGAKTYTGAGSQRQKLSAATAAAAAINATSKKHSKANSADHNNSTANNKNATLNPNIQSVIGFGVFNNQEHIIVGDPRRMTLLRLDRTARMGIILGQWVMDPAINPSLLRNPEELLAANAAAAGGSGGANFAAADPLVTSIHLDTSQNVLFAVYDARTVVGIDVNSMVPPPATEEEIAARRAKAEARRKLRAEKGLRRQQTAAMRRRKLLTSADSSGGAGGGGGEDSTAGGASGAEPPAPTMALSKNFKTAFTSMSNLLSSPSSSPAGGSTRVRSASVTAHQRRASGLNTADSKNNGDAAEVSFIDDGGRGDSFLGGGGGDDEGSSEDDLGDLLDAPDPQPRWLYQVKTHSPLVSMDLFAIKAPLSSMLPPIAVKRPEGMDGASFYKNAPPTAAAAVANKKGGLQGTPSSALFAAHRRASRSAVMTPLASADQSLIVANGGDSNAVSHSPSFSSSSPYDFSPTTRRIAVMGYTDGFVDVLDSRCDMTPMWTTSKVWSQQLQPEYPHTAEDTLLVQTFAPFRESEVDDVAALGGGGGGGHTKTLLRAKTSMLAGIRSRTSIGAMRGGGAFTAADASASPITATSAELCNSLRNEANRLETFNKQRASVTAVMFAKSLTRALRRKSEVMANNWRRASLSVMAPASSPCARRGSSRGNLLSSSGGGGAVSFRREGSAEFNFSVMGDEGRPPATDSNSDHHNNDGIVTVEAISGAPSNRTSISATPKPQLPAGPSEAPVAVGDAEQGALQPPPQRARALSVDSLVDPHEGSQLSPFHSIAGDGPDHLTAVSTPPIAAAAATSATAPKVGFFTGKKPSIGGAADGTSTPTPPTITSGSKVVMLGEFDPADLSPTRHVLTASPSPSKQRGDKSSALPLSPSALALVSSIPFTTSVAFDTPASAKTVQHITAGAISVHTDDDDEDEGNGRSQRHMSASFSAQSQTQLRLLKNNANMEGLIKRPTAATAERGDLRPLIVPPNATPNTRGTTPSPQQSSKQRRQSVATSFMGGGAANNNPPPAVRALPKVTASGSLTTITSPLPTAHSHSRPIGISANAAAASPSKAHSSSSSAALVAVPNASLNAVAILAEENRKEEGGDTTNEGKLWLELQLSALQRGRVKIKKTRKRKTYASPPPSKKEKEKGVSGAANKAPPANNADRHSAFVGAEEKEGEEKKTAGIANSSGKGQPSKPPMSPAKQRRISTASPANAQQRNPAASGDGMGGDDDEDADEYADFEDPPAVDTEAEEEVPFDFFKNVPRFGYDPKRSGRYRERERSTVPRLQEDEDLAEQRALQYELNAATKRSKRRRRGAGGDGAENSDDNDGNDDEDQQLALLASKVDGTFDYYAERLRREMHGQLRDPHQRNNNRSSDDDEDGGRRGGSSSSSGGYSSFYPSDEDYEWVNEDGEVIPDDDLPFGKFSHHNFGGGGSDYDDGDDEGQHAGISQRAHRRRKGTNATAVDPAAIIERDKRAGLIPLFTTRAGIPVYLNQDLTSVCIPADNVSFGSGRGGRRAGAGGGGEYPAEYLKTLAAAAGRRPSLSDPLDGGNGRSRRRRRGAPSNQPDMENPIAFADTSMRAKAEGPGGVREYAVIASFRNQDPRSTTNVDKHERIMAMLRRHQHELEDFADKLKMGSRFIRRRRPQPEEVLNISPALGRRVLVSEVHQHTGKHSAEDLRAAEEADRKNKEMSPSAASLAGSGGGASGMGPRMSSPLLDLAEGKRWWTNSPTAAVPLQPSSVAGGRGSSRGNSNVGFGDFGDDDFSASLSRRTSRQKDRLSIISAASGQRRRASSSVAQKAMALSSNNAHGKHHRKSSGSDGFDKDDDGADAENNNSDDGAAADRSSATTHHRGDGRPPTSPTQSKMKNTSGNTTSNTVGRAGTSPQYHQLLAVEDPCIEGGYSSSSAPQSPTASPKPISLNPAESSPIARRRGGTNRRGDDVAANNTTSPLLPTLQQQQSPAAMRKQRAASQQQHTIATAARLLPYQLLAQAKTIAKTPNGSINHEDDLITTTASKAATTPLALARSPIGMPPIPTATGGDTTAVVAYSSSSTPPPQQQQRSPSSVTYFMNDVRAQQQKCSTPQPGAMHPRLITKTAPLLSKRRAQTPTGMATTTAKNTLLPPPPSQQPAPRLSLEVKHIPSDLFDVNSYHRDFLGVERVGDDGYGHNVLQMKRPTAAASAAAARTAQQINLARGTTPINALLTPGQKRQLRVLEEEQLLRQKRKAEAQRREREGLMAGLLVPAVAGGSGSAIGASSSVTATSPASNSAIAKGSHGNGGDVSLSSMAGSVNSSKRLASRKARGGGSVDDAFADFD